MQGLWEMVYAGYLTAIFCLTACSSLFQAFSRYVS